MSPHTERTYLHVKIAGTSDERAACDASLQHVVKALPAWVDGICMTSGVDLLSGSFGPIHVRHEIARGRD